jgi:putative phage-type endonuclease
MTTNFSLVDLQQGTAEWLAWRHKGIGASEASTIMGENRFESPSELLKQKRGPVILDSFQNEAMALGTKLEPEARKLYIATTGNAVRPVCIQSFKYDWFRASLDGLSTNHDAVVEIKCGASSYRRVSQSHTIPSYYYGQVQHILAITELDSLDFWCYWPENPPVLLPVKRNEPYIERLLRKELEFWNLVTLGNSDKT